MKVALNWTATKYHIRGRKQVVQTLFMAGADINKTSERHNSELQMASNRGHDRVADI